jgi:hypothetical protein
MVNQENVPDFCVTQVAVADQVAEIIVTGEFPAYFGRNFAVMYRMATGAERFAILEGIFPR